ncbi:MAG: efflux RND transporter permease subunit [Opitutales bacterium]
MNPTAIALKNNRTTLVIYAVVMLVGLATYFSIGRLEYPEFTIRNAQIITSYPGRSAAEVEQEISMPLEQAVRQIAEIEEVISTSKPGLSIVSVSAGDQYFDLAPIWQDVRNQIANVHLPSGATTPSVNDKVGDVFPYVYALTGDGFPDRELTEYAEDISDDLLNLEGVAKVEIHGEQAETIYLEFSTTELASYGLSPTSVIQQLNSQNAVANSGNVLAGTERLNLVTLGEFETIEELADYRLSLPGNTTQVRISDLFDVKRGYKDPISSISHFNGERVVCIAVSMTPGFAVTDVGERLGIFFEKYLNNLPVGLNIETMFYQPKYVEASIQSFVANLGQAFFFVVLVMFLFAGLRLALIVGVLVPSAIMMTFAFMPQAGVQLEMMSIAALIIALGLLVDNAVVVSEQILVRLNQGQSRAEAVKAAGKGLLVPLLAASGTTIAAFSPIAIAEGATSEFTYSLFAVVSITLLSSWIISLTIIPIFCYYFLKPQTKDTFVGQLLAKSYDPYEKLLRFILKLGWVYPIIIVMLTFGAAYAFKFVPSIFFPPNERGQFIIDVELPLGTDILETEKSVQVLEDWLLAQEDVTDTISTWIGNGGPRWYLSLASEPANPNYSLLSILTKVEDPATISAFMDEIRSFAQENMVGARVSPKALENGPPVGDPIQILLTGKESQTIYELRDKIFAELADISGLYDMRDNWGAWVKQVNIDPDPVRTAQLGLTTESLAQYISLEYTGLTASQFREKDKSIPITIRSHEDYRTRPDRLKDLPIFVNQGTVPLSQVADVSVVFQPGSIIRKDGFREMTLKGKVTGAFASDILAEIQPRLAALMETPEWPAGYEIAYGGEQAESAESQGGIAAAMPISMAALSLILIAQFNSVRRFAIIMCTIPPMLIGVTPGLIITGSSFGFMTLLGLIALLGIIVNNAILLIDEINLQLEEQESLVEAIVTACRSRLRPIILTTCTTIVGLVPLALGGGGMWSSMAYAMMFGLGFATALTLLLCPVLFYLFFKRQIA